MLIVSSVLVTTTSARTGCKTGGVVHVSHAVCVFSCEDAETAHGSSPTVTFA